MSFYGEMPDSLNLIVNTSHPLVKKVLTERETVLGTDLANFKEQISALKNEEETLEESLKGKKDEEILQADKDKRDDLKNKISTIEDERKGKLEIFGKENKLAKQLVDLALLANGMLKGEELDKFVRRSVELIK
jgi:hypothetical protein